MPRPPAASGRRAGWRAALRAGRAAARAALDAPAAAVSPTPFEFVRSAKLASSSPASPNLFRVRPGIRTPFEFVAALEVASSSISPREAARLFARSYARALAR